jgi:hypothetical protein
LTTLTLVSTAAADAASCADAHLAGQITRSEGRLLQAREHFTLCGAESCPSVLRSECGQLLEEVSRELPALMVVAKDEAGGDVLDYQVFIDGVATPNSSMGKPLDPGTHALRVTAPGFESVELSFSLRVGEQRRRLDVRLRREGVVEQRPVWPLFVFGGVAAVGVSTFVVAGLDARSSERELETCSPNCAQDRVDSVETKYIVANVGLGVGLAALASGGVWWWLTADREPQQAQVALGLGGLTSVSVRGQF